MNAMQARAQSGIQVYQKVDRRLNTANHFGLSLSPPRVSHRGSHSFPVQWIYVRHPSVVHPHGPKRKDCLKSLNAFLVNLGIIRATNLRAGFCLPFY